MVGSHRIVVITLRVMTGAREMNMSTAKYPLSLNPNLREFLQLLRAIPSSLEE